MREGGSHDAAMDTWPVETHLPRAGAAVDLGRGRFRDQRDAAPAYGLGSGANIDSRSADRQPVDHAQHGLIDLAIRAAESESGSAPQRSGGRGRTGPLWN